MTGARRGQPRAARIRETRRAPMRISELVAATGVSKETIHFYLREGLLPRPKKTRRNMAYYDASHVERIELIRRLQSEKYLPLEVIKKVLGSSRGEPRGGAEDLELLAGLFHLTGREGGAALTRVELKRRSRLPEWAIERAERAQLIRAGAGGRYEPDDLRTLEQLRAAAAAVSQPGAPEPPGEVAFGLAVEGFQLCARHLEAMARDEARLFFERLLVAPEPIALLDGMRRAREPQGRFLLGARGRLLQREIAGYVAQIEAALDRTDPRSGGPSSYPLSDGTLAALGQPAAALGLAARAEEDPEAAELLALAEYTVGKIERCAQAARRGLERHGARPLLRAIAGAALVERGELEAGIGELEQAVRAEPSAIACAALGAARVRLCRRIIEQSGAGSALKQAAAGLADLARAGATAQLAANAALAGPLAAAGSWKALLVRGRVYASLPPFFRVGEAGLADLRAVLDATSAHVLPDPLERLGVRATLEGNAAHFLGLALGAPDDPEGFRLLVRAAELDPEGPLAARLAALEAAAGER